MLFRRLLLLSTQQILICPRFQEYIQACWRVYILICCLREISGSCCKPSPVSLQDYLGPQASLSSQTLNYSEDKFPHSLTKAHSSGPSQNSLPAPLFISPYCHQDCPCHLGMQVLKLFQALLNRWWGLQVHEGRKRFNFLRQFPAAIVLMLLYLETFIIYHPVQLRCM